ncbi:T9SS type B sorting domain-containing protein [Arenibacter troitsensis]|uniref:SprB repeat-containing protein n=1 Tax=Arenibacter troitsensis TaxID=188872 RepID=A0A1X7L2D7_9FLAO|nr:gliding motility-associated C-terminal domain-containing protein [Arenibacter troitsensis]SMG48018.1 SprB repeat-containing protein [Arenibacter troitsensis]
MIKSTKKLLLLFLLFSFNAWYSIAQVSTSVQNTNFNSCGSNLPQTELNLGNLVLSETLATDFGSGTFTFYIQAPSNFEIRATSYSETGTDISSASVVQDPGNASRLAVTITTNAQGSLDVFTIENVRIQLIPGSATTNGLLRYVLGGNANKINGLADNQNLANVSFTALTGGTGVNQQVCARNDIQNISITGSNITQSRTFEWEKDVNGTWTAIANSNTEILVVDKPTFPNGISRFRRLTTFMVNGESCTQISTTATITVNEIYAGTITEGTGQNVCATQIPEQLSTSGDVAVTPSGTTTYQWYKNDSGPWELINGATDNFYQPSALSTTTSFKRRVTNVLNGFSCYKETPAVSIIVNSAVLGGTAANQNICSLSELQLLTINNGENNGTYQWQKYDGSNWVNISGATQSNYNASANLNPGVEQFRRVTTVSGASCQGVSTVATITYTNFAEGSITGTETVCYNEAPAAITSDTNATGTGTISYQWERFDGSSWAAISGANNADYQPSALTQTTTFRRQDSILLNSYTCSDYTNEIEITVLGQINGGTASADQTICAGETPNAITINNATAAGPNISYQWQSATTGSFTNISGETNAVYNFAGAPAVTTRYRRQTIVSNNAKVCFQNSTVSTVYVNSLNVGTIGSNQNVCAGQAPSTIINIGNTTAAGNLTYAWEASTDNGASWNPIASATGSTYTPGILATTTKYRRLDTTTLNGKVCSAYTNEVSIVVAGAISGGEGSADQAICEGDTPSTITVSNGTPAGTGINFQWYSSTDNVNYTLMSGETGEELNFSTGLTTSTYFRRNVTNTNNGNTCEALSLPTLVTLITLNEGTISQTQTVCGSSNVAPITSLADASSNGAISYTWQSSPDGSTWTDIANTNQATYTPTNTGDLQTYYRRKASSTLQSITCEAITTPVIVYVNKFDNPNSHRITFSSGATGTTEVCNGGDPQAFSTNFPLIASGTVSYQWQISSDNISYSDIGGATSATYDPPAVTQDNYYRRITTSTLNGLSCSVTSNVLTIINGGNATGGTIGTTNPNGVSPSTNGEVICKGDIPSEIVQLTASTGETLTYQWYANGTPILNATGINYTPTNIVNSTTTYIRTTTSTDISGVECVVDSNPVTVLVPQADNLGNNITICYNTMAPTLGNPSAIEGLPYLTFEWYESTDGSTFNKINGATSETYTPATPLTADRYYRRDYLATVEGIACEPSYTPSNVIRIFVNDVDGGTISGDDKICFGDDPSVLGNTVAGTAEGVLKYQWYSSTDNTNWGIINGAVNSTYDPIAGSYPTTYFKRTASSTLNGVVCTEDSNTIVVQVTEQLLPGTLTNDQTICEGVVPAALTVTGGSTYVDQTYDWYASTDGSVWTDLAVHSASYTPPVPTATMYYKRTITRTSLVDQTCVVETNPIKVTLNHVYAGKITDNQSVCEGSQPLAIVEQESATGAGVLTYQWWSSPDNQTYTAVAGATQPNYTPPSTLTASTYFKRVVTSTVNGVACADETSPKIVTVIPYAIINNDAIIANDITNVSCNAGNDGSIVIPNSRITGGNTAQKQINTISLFGTPTLGNTYSILIDGKVYDHQVTLNGINQPQDNNEVAADLVQKINTATGPNLSSVVATRNFNEITLTAKVAGIGFTAYVSTGSDPNVSSSNVITQPNSVANTYVWSKIGDNSFTASTLSISNLTAGAYQLTVYNEFCGTTSTPFIVSEPEVLTLNIGDTCNTAITAYSTGGIAPFTFTLTRPNGTTLVQTSNNPNITYTNLTGGATYNISVQDASCGIQESQSVTLPMGLQFDQASVVVENATCYGQNDGSISLNIGATTVTGGKAPYSFSWTGPNNANFTTENISNLVPGVYVLSVTDQLGCSATYTANVASKAQLEISSVQVINQQLQCAGDANAEISIQISSDPSSQLQINWYKNGTSYSTNNTSLTNLGGGSYEVVIIDTNSDANTPCTVRQTFVITAPTVFSATEVTNGNTSCVDANTGRDFTFRVQGGTSPFQYSLDGGTPVIFTNTQTTISSLSNDSHVIEVTDANQCVVQTFTMESYEAMDYTGAKAYTIPPCESNFAFSLNTNLVTGGKPFVDGSNNPYYFYDWRGPNNFVAQDITSFDAVPGSYWLTITDSNDCSSEEIEFTFSTTYQPIVVNKTITPVSCGATNDGAISITISGGLRPYSIRWEKETAGTANNPDPVFTPFGQNITQLSGLEEGRLRLTITSNINGCTNSDPAYYYQEIITINKAESLQLIDGPYLDQSLCLGNPGSISVSVFNSQPGDLSFYYEGALVPSVKTGTNTYSVQIGNPLDNATLNVVNDQGCGITMPISSGVTDPSFTYSSDEYEITGLLMAKEDIRFSITSDPGYGNASWDFGDGSPIVNVDPEIDGIMTTHKYSYPGIFTTTLTLYNAEGCSKTVQQDVQVGNGYDVMFPNVFSANADGINDYFQGEFTGIASFTFQIYDMWGSLVYSVAYDYDSMPTNWGWNGNYSSGKPYKNTSFRYLFVGTTRDNNQITKTGEASILR